MKAAKELEQLTILQGGREAGVLQRSAQGASFAYASAYLADAKTYGIAFNMPKRTEPYAVQGYNLHPFFAGLLPEGLRLRALVRTLKTSEDDLFSLFAALGTSCIGDVSPADGEVPKEIEAPKLSQLSFREYFAEIISRANLARRGNDTIPGVQDKISSAVISMPLNVARQTQRYILKLNSKDFSHIVRNEQACLVFAQRCGLRVNSCKIVRDRDQEEGLLVTRFDRVWNAARGAFDLVHVEDACQVLDRYPSEKYRLSLREVVEGIVAKSFTPEIEALEVIMQYLFSYLIGNGDMHAKNISLMRDPLTDRVMLSPCYDLVCTLLYPELDEHMALKMEGRDKNLSFKLFASFAERFRISEKIVHSKVSALLRRYSRHRESFLQALGQCSPSEKLKMQVQRELARRFESLQEGL